MTYHVLAFYSFDGVKDPHREVKEFHRYFKEKDAKGRIYISDEGINGQMSILETQSEGFIKWMHAREAFKLTEVKVHTYPDHAFAKMTVKYREQLVALDLKIDTKKGGKHLTPKEWKAMLDQKDDNTLLIDVRNNYEWEVGHFEGAEKPDLETFRQFPEYAEGLTKKVDPKKTKVMMYCTGGIRCEPFSALLKEKGFDEVYQLGGGIIKYGLEEGDDHFKGNLFVFDDRMVAPISGEKQEAISTCCFCSKQTDRYYNCANMECNALFISCPECATDKLGCCSKECEASPRRRDFEDADKARPYRKIPFEVKQAMQKDEG